MNGAAQKQPSLTYLASKARRTAMKIEARVQHGDSFAADGLASEHLNAELALAVAYHAEADDLLRPEGMVQVANGEVIANAPDTPTRADIRDTLAKPSQIAIDASIARTDLLVQVQSDVLALAVDAAHSAGARNSLEKMLSHQLALLHSASMRVMDRGLQAKAGEQAGLLNSATRMMSTFQQGMLALQRLHSEASQTVIVKHVTVESGGQAVIGAVERGRKSKSEP